MQTDPIADLLTRIRNACTVSHPSVEIPASRLKIEIVKLLQREGYVQSYETRENEESGFQTLRVALKYDREGFPVIRKIRRVSRPGLRRYSNVDSLPRVLNGAGVAIVSTNKGILTDREARFEKVGGEVLAYVY